jgi:hypothetical protein
MIKVQRSVKVNAVMWNRSVDCPPTLTFRFQTEKGEVEIEFPAELIPEDAIVREMNLVVNEPVVGRLTFSFEREELTR